MDKQEIELFIKPVVESEYVVVVVDSSNFMWIKKLLEGIKEKNLVPIVIYCDKTSATNISKNLVMHTKIKHIAIKYH